MALSVAWNLREFGEWKKTEGYTKVRNSNAEVTLMAVPLTLGMTVNGIFMTGLLFVPKLWSVIDYLMPVAILMYGAVGAISLLFAIIAVLLFSVFLPLAS